MEKQKFSYDVKWITSVIFALVGIGLFYSDRSAYQAFWITAFIASTVLIAVYLANIISKNWNEIARILNFRSIGGIVRFYGERSDFKWENFFHQHSSPREVIFMGQSLGKAFDDSKQTELFTEWCRKGTVFKILLLSPSSSYSQQLRSVGEGMIEAPADQQPQQNLVNKIYSTVAQIENNLIKNIGDVKKQPYVRFSTVDLPFSFTMIDNDMVVTTYTTEPEADKLPTFVIKGQNSPAFQGFKKEFESIWEKHSVVSPYKDIIIKENLRDWKQFLQLKKSYYDKSAVIYPPKQAIVFLTYQCSNSCGYCMYKEKKSNVSLSTKNFQNILKQLITYGVSHIEISGGGEPLETPNLNEIMKALTDMREQYPEIKFGLLTNGLYLEKSLKSTKYDLLYIFNDYIRVSRLIESDLDIKNETFFNKQTTWYKGIMLLCEKKDHNQQKYSSTKIGMKYLLSSRNEASFVSLVREDISKFLDKFDHVRFRSERTVNSNRIFPIEQDVYRALRSSEKIRTRFEEKIALSLPNIYYPHNFKCWISPIHVVIDPQGDVYTCCNYVMDSGKANIGNILAAPFKNIWESEKHISARHKLSKEICNCEKSCANCRFAELQFNYEQIIATLGYDYLRLSL